MLRNNMMSSKNTFKPVLLNGADGASAKVYPYGAHVTNWCTADGIERLFLSERAEFKHGMAVRGGVPIIFPQFADLGSLAKHGLARTACWQQVSAAECGLSSVTFCWQEDRLGQEIWPHSFAADYQVELGIDSLKLILSIYNAGKQSFSFTAALHTYLRVDEIAHVSVSGLQGMRYRDSALGGTAEVDSDSALVITGELDRIYFGTTKPIQVMQVNQRTVECIADGFKDTVIWNPGPDKSAALPDMQSEGFRHMLCVEAAIIESPVMLSPGMTWTGSQLLQLR